MDKKEELKQILAKGTQEQKRIILRFLQCYELSKRFPNCKGTKLFNSLLNDAGRVKGLEADKRISKIELAFIHTIAHDKKRRMQPE